MTALARRRVNRHIRTEPTPETERKLQPDVLRTLHAEKRIDDSQLTSGEQIRDMWSALGRGMFGGGGAFNGAHVQTWSHHDVLDRLTAEEAHQWKWTWSPWVRLNNTVRLLPANVARTRIVLDVAIDNHDLATLAVWYRRYADPDLLVSLKLGLDSWEDFAS